MKQIVIIVVAVFAGFLGGIVGTRVESSRQEDPAQVIRARSFELVDATGRVISYWGIDTGQNAVIAFGNRRTPGQPSRRLQDPENQLAAIGLLGETMPYLKLSGADRKARVRLYLSMEGKPMLLMEDETGPRLSLGLEQSDTPGPQDNDWSLVFRPEVARIGFHAETQNGKTYVQGGVFVRKDKVEYPSK